MTIKFEDMTLLRVFHTVDMAHGTLICHEVRRDEPSGLTLTRKQPVTNPEQRKEPQSER